MEDNRLNKAMSLILASIIFIRMEMCFPSVKSIITWDLWPIAKQFVMTTSGRRIEIDCLDVTPCLLENEMQCQIYRYYCCQTAPYTIFPKGNDGEGKFNNVKAGTVVDQTICHPNEVQFFLCSHKAIQGTSKHTRYNVIIDDAKIDIDDLQALTYNLCHLFPRCNRSVSYPAPAYLAHLVGLRGRAYIEGSNLNLENLKGEYNKRLVSNDVMKLNPMYFV